MKKAIQGRSGKSYYRDFLRLVKKNSGWMEGDIARFPSVYNREQFEKDWDAFLEEKKND